MAEAVAALALGASIISFIDIGGKVITRVGEYTQTSQEVPEVLRDVQDRLETLLLTTKNLQSALNAGKLDGGARAALKSTVGGLERQALVLQGLCEHVLPSLGDMWWQKARKAVSSLRKEKELKSVLQKIIAYESTLNLYFTSAMSLKDSSSVHWTKRTYHDVPPFALDRFIGRRRILDQLTASFNIDNLEHRIKTVLLGIGALSGMQRVSQLLDSSTTSDPSSHMQGPPATKLENLLHPFLIVLDNMDHARDFTEIMKLMPENKMCMVLITSRHRDAQQLGTCIEIKPMEQDEAVELLLTKCNIASALQHHAHAESIVQTLAHLPLAIDQAGAYISSRNLPLARFTEHFNIRKEVIMNYIPSGWPYQRAHDDQQRVSDLCVFTTWELSLDELGSSVDAEPFTDLLTFAAFTASSLLLTEMLRTQVEENLAAELGCRALYTTDSKWDPWKYQDAVVQLYSVSLVSEIDMGSAETTFVIHPLVREWLKVRAGGAKDKMYIEANTKLIHRVCDRHIERITNFYADERVVLYCEIVYCAMQNGVFNDLNADEWPVISKFSEVFVSALPSFVRCCVDCGQLEDAIAFMVITSSCMVSELGFVMAADLRPRFLCATLCASRSIALYDSEWLESHRISKNVLRLPDLKRMLEGGRLKMLRPGERCVQWLELLCGQVCIQLGEIEAARQLLTDGFATSQQTFGTGDVLTMEFQTRLVEVHIRRGEIQLATLKLSPAVTEKKSGRSDLCAITARTLQANIVGSLDEAESLSLECLNQAMLVLGGDHSMIWRIWYIIIGVKLGQMDYATAEQYLRELRDLIIEAKGPEHLEVFHVTLDLAGLKLRAAEYEEAGQICQALLVQQQKRLNNSDDLITFTKAILWMCHLRSRRTDIEGGLKADLLESLGNASVPNPQLAEEWLEVVLFAIRFGAVDVIKALKKHYYKAMKLAFGVEYLQALIRKEASPEDSNNE